MLKKICLLFIFTGSFILFGCDEDTNTGCICTEEYRMYNVVIIDSLNKPIKGLTISFVDVNGVERVVSTEIDPFFNSYMIMNDGFVELMSVSPKPFLVKAYKQNFNIKQTYYFYTDKCKCHVNKYSGPDTIKVM
ncbi:MAG: hypothetical protein V1773_19750 [bacterium]